MAIPEDTVSILSHFSSGVIHDHPPKRGSFEVPRGAPWSGISGASSGAVSEVGMAWMGLTVKT